MSDNPIHYDDLTYLNALEERLKSGALGKDFKFGSESKKQEILELLQKVMDVADLADEAATKMIFKGSLLETLVGGGQEDGAQENGGQKNGGPKNGGEKN